MDLRVMPPELQRLDETRVELCACAIWSDQRPARGLAALLDWRMGGALSALMKSGVLRGDLGEALLSPGKPVLAFEKVLVLGLGPRAAFGEDVFRNVLDRLATALEGLRVRRAIVELPGRSCDAIDARRASEIVRQTLDGRPQHDAWWLVEDAAAQGRGSAAS